MSPVDQALQTMLGWFRTIFAAFVTVFGIIEGYLREWLLQLGVPGRLQGTIIVIAAVLFIIAILRLFGGIFRILLIVFLILLVVHVVAPLFAT